MLQKEMTTVYGINAKYWIKSAVVPQNVDNLNIHLLGYYSTESITNNNLPLREYDVLIPNVNYLDDSEIEQAVIDSCPEFSDGVIL